MNPLQTPDWSNFVLRVQSLACKDFFIFNIRNILFSMGW